MKGVARAIYGLLGAVAIVLSILVLCKPALALHPEDYSPLTAHLIREQGAEGLFIGLMAFWCLLNFDKRRPVHFALILFTALFAGIHWAEYFHARRQLSSPLLNSIPLLLLIAATPFRFQPNEAHRGNPDEVM